MTEKTKHLLGPIIVHLRHAADKAKKPFASDELFLQLIFLDDEAIIKIAKEMGLYHKKEAHYVN